MHVENPPVVEAQVGSSASAVVEENPAVVEENPAMVESNLVMVVYKDSNERVGGEVGEEIDGEVGGEIDGEVGGEVGGEVRREEEREEEERREGGGEDVEERGGGDEVEEPPAETVVPAIPASANSETRSFPAEVEEEVNPNDGGSSSRTVSEMRASGEAMEDCDAMPPLAMYFNPSQYHKKIKISTRCFINETMETLENLEKPMTKKERMWFTKHPQFKHIFHMPRDRNHKVQGMWMLLLRTVVIDRKNEVWFIVNGVPIRYGLTEHALLSGFNCRNYPADWKSMGSTRFVEKHFGTGATVRYADVKEKLLEMQPSTDRLKMMVLYFLAGIVGGQTKTGKDAPSVEPFFLRVVDDLPLCRTFPWGRLSFHQMIREIKHTMDHFGGEVRENVLWPIPGFCIPMELLAFESIIDLQLKFREPVVDADSRCPRMCKYKFKKCVMKGFPLSSIYEALGHTKVIDIMLIPEVGEEDLLHDMIEPDEDDDVHDVVVESWMQSLRAGHQICFQNMFEEDVAARVTQTLPANEGNATTHTLPTQLPTHEAPASSSEPRVEKLQRLVEHLQKKILSLEARVKEIEDNLS